MRLRRDVRKSLRRVAGRLGLMPRGATAPSAASRSPNIERFKDYEQNWAPVLASAQRIARTETSLARAVALVGGMEGVSPVRYEPYRIVSCGALADVSTAGFGAIYGDILLRSVLEMCAGTADTVMELGSGWGNYLFRVWLSGGPRDARYYACEYTRTGRTCTEVLAALEPELRIAALELDYRRPDFSGIQPGAHTVVYTSHSVEQVDVLPRALFEKLLALSDRVSGLHLEPVGWQVRRQRGERLPPFSEAHQRRCEKYEYNRNLWPLLLELEAEGLIQIQQAIPDIVGMEYNPATLIRWVKR